MAAYYNEFDKPKAAWLRELIKAGAIADGEVDERSITEVQPGDVAGFTQCHWFAGIGIWSYALRLAGFPDDRECWTASCPCQPFSQAGKRKATADRRHLWPELFRIYRERRPVLLFGEQVQSPDGLAWLDIVSTDLESLKNTIGATGLCSASVGAAHARNRLFFVARTPSGEGWPARPGETESGRSRDGLTGHGAVGVLGYTNEAGSQGRSIGRDIANERTTGAASVVSELEHAETQRRGETGKRRGRSKKRISDASELSGVGNADGPERWSHNGQRGSIEASGRNESADRAGESVETSGLADASEERIRAAGHGRTDEPPRSVQGIDRQRERLRDDARQPGPTNGFWSDAGWIYCRPERPGEEGKYRPVKPRPFEMDDGLAGDLGCMCVPCLGNNEGREVVFPLIQKGKARVQRLRGYGDGIVAQVAAEFIKSYMEERGIF